MPMAVADAESISGTVSWQLVQAAQQGSASAFAQIYADHAGEVFGYLYGRTGDRALAQDLASETFVRALRAISSLRDRGRPVGAWLITIARNLILDHRKSVYARLVYSGDELLADVADTADGPEQRLLRKARRAEVTEQVRRGLAELTEEQRECLRFRFGLELSVAETAKRMGRNSGAVRALQHRGIQRLADHLALTGGGTP